MWQADKLAGKFLGDSSVLAAGSEGTVDTLTLPAASCPAATAQDPNQQDAPANSPLHQDMPPQQQQQQQEEQGTPNGTEQPEKRQKTESNRPAEKARGSDSQQQHAVRDAVQPRAPTVIKTEAPAEMAPGAQKPVQASDERIARAMVGRVGKLGMDVIRDTMMCQQALWTEQVQGLFLICMIPPLSALQAFLLCEQWRALRKQPQICLTALQPCSLHSSLTEQHPTSFTKASAAAGLYRWRICIAS